MIFIVTFNNISVTSWRGGVHRHVQQYFSYIVAGRGLSSRSTIFQLYRGVSFIGEIKGFGKPNK
jgi:hypothetical protein